MSKYKNIAQIASVMVNEVSTESLENYEILKIGTKISSRYRAATMEGTIVSILKEGRTAASTIYEIVPTKESMHKGEPATVHRHGNKITVIDEFNKVTHSKEPATKQTVSNSKSPGVKKKTIADIALEANKLD